MRPGEGAVKSVEHISRWYRLAAAMWLDEMEWFPKNGKERATSPLIRYGLTWVGWDGPGPPRLVRRNILNKEVSLFDFVEEIFPNWEAGK